jgi:ABC-type transport system involved in multi-copper enzyme maturation permease subunit
MFAVVFVREIAGLARRAGAPALLLGPLCLFCGLVLLRWPAEGEADAAGQRAIEVFRLFAYGLAATVLLLAPAAPAAAIVEQRRRGTLTLLLHTPLSAGAIYLGLLLASLALIALPVAMSLPAAAACYSLGALDAWNHVGLLYALLLATAVECSAIGLAISCRAQAPVTALRGTYAVVAGLAFAALIPAWLAQRGGERPSAAATAAAAFSPVPALWEIVGQADQFGGGPAAGGAPLRYVATACALSLLLAAYAIGQLRPGVAERTRDAGVMTEDRSVAEQRRRRWLYLVDPQRRSRGIPSWANPVLFKEFRTRRFGRGSWTLRLLALCAVISLGTTLAATSGAIRWSTESIGGFMIQLQVLLVLVVTPTLASGLVSDEWESGSWALLRMTPLSSWQIVAGKLASTIASVVLLLGATLPGYAVIMLIKPVMTRQVLTVLATLALTGALCIALSAALSSLLLRTARATLAAYALMIAFFGGTLAIWACRDAPFGPALVENALAFNPVAAALAAMEAPGFADYHLLPRCWYTTAAATAALLALLCVRTRRLTLPD